MKTYLVARREELKKRQNKGFTLMEMLIVVAIIAVLIAIAIPVFTSQLEKSRDAASVANMRSAYAEAQAAYLVEDDSNDNITFTRNGTSKAIETVKVGNLKIETAQANKWSDSAGDLPFTAPEDNGAESQKMKAITFTYDANGKITKAELSES